MLWLGSASFFTLGVVLVLLGVHQAEMTRDLQLGLSAFGLLGAVLALGFGIGLMAAGPLVDRLSQRWLFAGACALSGLSAISVGAGLAPVRIGVHLVLLGLGGGCCVTLMNAAVLEQFRERAAPALALMHATATAGASSGPWLIAWLQARSGGGWPGTFHAIGAAYLALALFGSTWRTQRAHSAHDPNDARALRSGGQRLVSPQLVALAAIGFAYVGVESGLTLFAVPWAKSQGHTEAVGRSAISAFWFGLMTGAYCWRYAGRRRARRS